MRVMFVCAGGMSTALTAKKLEEVAAKNNVDMSVTAFGTEAFAGELQKEKYDIVLVAPQIRHRFNVISDTVAKHEGVKAEKIPPQMYAPMEPAVTQLFNLIMDIMK